MYFWNSYPFIRFSLALIGGIILVDHFDYPSVYFLSASAILFVLSRILSSKIGFNKMREANGILGLAFFIFLGSSVTQIQYHQKPGHHYMNLDGYLRGFSGVITTPANERTNFFRYEFEVSEVLINDKVKESTGTIFLYVRKDSMNEVFEYGDRLLVKGNFFPVAPPGNPHEFNYKKYLERQNIYAQAFVDRHSIKWIDKEVMNPILALSFEVRNEASRIIDRNIPHSRENGIAKALLLGIKDHLDNDIKQSYAAAGAMHVLAVSGLHVGIIYLILKILFGRINRLGRRGKLLFGLSSVTCIWFYAMVTGLSPSVLRAATMFSLVAISEAANRDNNIYNTLGIAAFILLLYDPYLVYSVGFQLSFAAVFGIVYLQPKLYRLVSSNIWIVDKAWAITCVSIAAQLATFPISAYYFHQFPTYFLLSNLIVIPSAFIMLVSGVTMLLVDPIIPIIGQFIGQLIGRFMWGVNEVISLVDHLPSSLIEWIHVDLFAVVFTYLITISIFAGLYFRSFKTLVFSSILVLTLIVGQYLDFQKQENKHQLVFYDVKHHVVIDHIRGHDLRTFISEADTFDLDLLGFQVNPNRLASDLVPIEKSIQNAQKISFENEIVPIGLYDKKVLFFDSTTFHFKFSAYPKADIVYIRNESVKSLQWLTSHFRPDQIILGSNNRKNYVKKMAEEAKDLGIVLHSMETDGAFIINL